ncbi:MAG: DctP family TRAP transporter solute-binding subunit [Desulfobacteraceae bacterium]|nr:MAG: DctP family TRAP transporter solute-binding subunit [Desulfobacteraceae bacterium]
MKMRSCLAFSGVLIAFFIAAQISDAAGGKEIKIGLSYQAAPSANDPWHHLGLTWQSLLKEKTGGRIQLDLFPGGTLSGGNQQKEIELLQSGVIQASILPTGTLTVIDPRFHVVGLPWIVPTSAAADKLMDGPLGQETMTWLRAKRLEPIAVASNGFRQLANRKRAVAKPGDLTGLKLRVPGSKVLVEAWKALGAQPVVVNFAELYTALQQGTVDGEELPWVYKLSTKFYEVEKYGTELNYSFDLIYLIFSQQQWNGISPADQEILRSTAQMAAKDEREFLAKSNREVIDKLKANGMEIAMPTAEQLAAFQAKMPLVYKQFEPQIGQAVIDRFQKEL